MVFITAGMGGGTGTGAAPVVAQLAKELGILTVAVVTKPFEMEGKKRLRARRRRALPTWRKYVDSLITIPNEKLLTVLGGDTTLLDAFKAANEVLQGAVQGIAELITRPGLINVDFADVRTVMSEMGMAMMGSGAARRGPGREAAEAAISEPPAGGHQPGGCQRHPGERHGRHEPPHWRIPQVGETVKQCASDDATVVVGTVIDPEMSNSIRVTVVATGLGGRRRALSQGAQRRSRSCRRTCRHRPNYGRLDPPTFIRQRAVGDNLPAGVRRLVLDIPAFLRRQAGLKWWRGLRPSVVARLNWLEIIGYCRSAGVCRPVAPVYVRRGPAARGDRPETMREATNAEERDPRHRRGSAHRREGLPDAASGRREHPASSSVASISSAGRDPGRRRATSARPRSAPRWSSGASRSRRSSTCCRPWPASASTTPTST